MLDTPQASLTQLCCFSAHSSLLAKLGIYENVSKNQSCSPKGILYVLPLLKWLVELELTCEIHGSSLRQAIMQVVMQEPALNTSIYNGSVWVGSGVGRITTLLFHLRRWKELFPTGKIIEERSEQCAP